MEDEFAEERIETYVAIARLLKMILSMSQRTDSKIRISRREKMEEILYVLKDYGSYINTPDYYGDTIMHTACRLDKCDIDVLRELLKHGGQVDLLNGSGESCLHLVAKHSRKSYEAKSDMMRELLKYDHNPNITNFYGETPLHIALRQSSARDLDLVLQLFVSGADIRIADNQGKTSLHLAVKNPFCRHFITSFLKKAPELAHTKDKLNNTPLHIAVRYCNNLATVKILLQHSADPNVKNHLGRTPLHNAVLKSQAEAVELLLENKADVNALDCTNRSPLHCALDISVVNISIIKILIKYGADVNALNEDNFSPLMLCAMNHKDNLCDLFPLFIERGAIPNFDEKCNILVYMDDLNCIPYVEMITPYIFARLIATDYFLSSFQEGLDHVVNKYHYILSLHSEWIYIDFMKEIGSRCVAEIVVMKDDFISETQTLFEFVFVKFLISIPYDHDVPACVVDEVLLRWKSGKYVLCKDLIYNSIKRTIAKNRLCELELYYRISDYHVVKLDSLCVYNIGKYLSKDDIINMIFVFCDKFKISKNHFMNTSKRGKESGGTVKKKVRGYSGFLTTFSRYIK